MNEEEKKAVEILQGLCTDDCINNDVVQTIVNLIGKQQKEIEKLKEKHKKVTDEYLIQRDLINADFLNENYINKYKILAVFKKYALDEQECFFSTSDIIKFVKDMRKLMGIGD